MKVLIFLHRWLGTATCVFFFTWFASGIVMMYAEMPELSRTERLAVLPPLDAARAQLSAAAAMDKAELREVTNLKLTSLFGRPAWRVRDFDGQWHTVFADNGDVRDEFQYQEAQESLRPFLTAGAHPRLVATLDGPDQWTIGGGYGALRPLYHVALDDDAGTELYIASATGEVVLRSTRRTRTLAWFGAIPHWLYLAALRKRGALWSKVVIWLSGIGCFVALLGLTVGLLRFSPARRYFVRGGNRRASPYTGMMKWHHWFGLIFGVLTFTWVFSGLLSMGPGDWSTGSEPTREQAAQFSGDNLDFHAFDASPAALLAGHPAAKEIELHRVADRPYYLIAETDRRELVDGAGQAAGPFPTKFLIDAAQRAVPRGEIAQETVLERYDAYYYDRDRNAPLPVLRVKFDDPARSWLYIDPQQGEIVARYERSGRVERWLYHGFHSFDFPFLWYLRPAWDIVVIALSLGGLLLSGTGIVIGYRNLRGSLFR